MGDVLWSIPLFSLVSNDDSGKYFVLTMYSIVLHSFLLIVFIGNWFNLEKTNREADLFIFYRVDGDDMNHCRFGHWFSVNVVFKSCICSMYKKM